MHEAQIVECILLVANDEAAEIAEPRKESLNLPATPKSPQGTAILRLRLGAVAPIRCDQFRPQACQRHVEGIGIIGTGTNEGLGWLVDEVGIERDRDEGHFVRRSRSGTDSDRKASAVCDCHELRTFASLGRAHIAAPSFATMNVPSMKRSDRSSLPRSLRSRANASNPRSSVSSRTQRWKRWSQV